MHLRRPPCCLQQGIQRKPALLRPLPEDLACVQVIVRDVGIFNDTLVRDLLEDLGQLKESDIVLVNWGAWYPRFTWGATEVGAPLLLGAACISIQSITQGASEESRLHSGFI